MKTNYKEQLADSRWLRKKNEILERDNYTCQKCGSTSHLNVHHLNYEKGKLAWEYPNERLITLCQDCHENEHDIVPILQIGKFYTYDHSDFCNDMLCYHIDNYNKLVYLFGIDIGSYGGAYIDIMSFDEFYSKCSYSQIFNNDDYDYCQCSFYYALENLKTHNVAVLGRSFYDKESIASYALNRIETIISNNEYACNRLKEIAELESIK